MPFEIAHFGPDPNELGGISTVLRTFEHHQIGGAVRVFATWNKRGFASTLWAVTRSLVRLVSLPRRSIVHVHLSYDGSFVREGAVVVVSSLLGRPTIANLHGGRFPEFAARHRRLARFVLRRASVVCPLTAEADEVVRSLDPRIRRQIVGNPVPIPENVSKPVDMPPVALLAGALCRGKGVDVLADAWPRVREAVPDAVAVLVGPRTEALPPLPDGVEARDALPLDELRGLLGEVRVAVLPSRSEAMPMFLLEAQAAGRPIVATPVGAVPEMISSSGLLVPVGDAAALASAVTRLLVDDDEATTLGATGRRTCRARNGVEAVGATYRDLYATFPRAIAGRSARPAEH